MQKPFSCVHERFADESGTFGLRLKVPLFITKGADHRMYNRISNREVEAKVTTAAAAAQLIKDGMTVGMSGFSMAGYPKAVPPPWPDGPKRASASRSR